MGGHGDADEARSLNAQSDSDTAEREHRGTSLLAQWHLDAASESAQDAIHDAVDACAADVIYGDHDTVWAEAERARYAEFDAEVRAELDLFHFAYRPHEQGHAALWLLALLGVVLPTLILATRGFGVVSAAMGAR